MKFRYLLLAAAASLCVATSDLVSQTTGSSSSLGPSYTYKAYTYNEADPISQAKASALCNKKGGWLATATTREQHDQLVFDLGADEDQDRKARWSWRFQWGGESVIALTSGIRSDPNDATHWTWNYGPPGVINTTVDKAALMKPQYCLKPKVPCQTSSSSRTCRLFPTFCNFLDSGTEDVLGVGPMKDPRLVYLVWSALSTSVATKYVCQFETEGFLSSSSSGGGNDGFSSSQTSGASFSSSHLLPACIILATSFLLLFRL